MSLQQQDMVERDYCNKISYNKLAVLIKIRNTCVIYFKTKESLINSIPIDDSSHIILIKDFYNFDGNLCAEIREWNDYETLYDPYINMDDYTMLENYLAEHKHAIILIEFKYMINIL